jgi:hypothetical protein
MASRRSPAARLNRRLASQAAIAVADSVIACQRVEQACTAVEKTFGRIQATTVNLRAEYRRARSICAESQQLRGVPLAQQNSRPGGRDDA